MDYGVADKRLAGLAGKRKLQLNDHSVLSPECVKVAAIVAPGSGSVMSDFYPAELFLLKK
jgi:hypothetical protein